MDRLKLKSTNESRRLSSSTTKHTSVSFQQHPHQRRRRNYPPLWKTNDDSVAENDDYDQEEETLQSLMETFSSQPDPKPLWELVQNALVVGQEFTLTCYFLARHRQVQQEQDLLLLFDANDKSILSLLYQILVLTALPLSLLLTAIFSNSEKSRFKTLTRLRDAALLAVLLRFVAAALKTLTASYSSDTVHALAIGGMVLHLFWCDYSYANGIVVSSSPARKHHQPPFLGGTMSLNAAFFSTTLLASRLESNATVHIFVSSSVTMFAFFPATRHGLFSKSPTVAPYVLLTTILLLGVATVDLLKSWLEYGLFFSTLIAICLVAPTWKCFLQTYKVTLSGPWDIAHITTTTAVVGEEEGKKEEPNDTRMSSASSSTTTHETKKDENFHDCDTVLPKDGDKEDKDEPDKEPVVQKQAVVAFI